MRTNKREKIYKSWYTLGKITMPQTWRFSPFLWKNSIIAQRQCFWRKSCTQNWEIAKTHSNHISLFNCNHRAASTTWAKSGELHFVEMGQFCSVTTLEASICHPLATVRQQKTKTSRYLKEPQTRRSSQSSTCPWMKPRFISRQMSKWRCLTTLTMFNINALMMK